MRDITSDQAERILADRYRTDFRAFVKKVFAIVSPSDVLAWGWYNDAICDYLRAVELGHIQHLVINQPPRTLKSIASTVAWPAWLLGQNPGQQIIAAAYGSDLCKKHSMDCRLVIESEWYKQVFPETVLSKDQNEKDKYITTKRGQRVATSVGGAVLGDGGNILIGDDLLKPDEAVSDAVRKHTNDWVRQSFLTRFNDKRTGKSVIVMQRLHEDDVAGNLLADEGVYTHLNLPAEFTKKIIIPNPLGGLGWTKEAGELLDPVRLSARILEAERIKLGEVAYAGQYMQNPSPAEGGMVKWEWFKRYKERPLAFDAIIQSWDTAVKTAVDNDWSVGMTWGVRWDGYYLLNVVRKKLQYPELKAVVRRMYEDALPRYILVEDKASGQQLLQDYGAQRGVPMIGIIPERSKVIRFSTVTDVIETGKVWLPEEAPWLETFKEELRVFPNGKHDDQIDCLSLALGWLKINFDKLSDNVNVFEQTDPLMSGYTEPESFSGRSRISGY